MPIAEILVGISLVKASASAIKEGCSAAKSLSDMASSVDALFEGTKQVQKARANHSGMSIKDQLGAGSAAQEVIDARLAKELMHEARMAISMRFGPACWTEIVQLQQARDKEAKRLAAVEKQQQLEKREAIQGVFIVISSVVIGITIIAIIGAVIWASQQVPPPAEGVR
ncbi:hypothetical protein N9C56_00170 [Paracoccaceae bacterium]|nr:hypothetical protein [Paracoccaceae bacterium]